MDRLEYKLIHNAGIFIILGIFVAQYFNPPLTQSHHILNLNYIEVHAIKRRITSWFLLSSDPLAAFGASGTSNSDRKRS